MLESNYAPAIDFLSNIIGALLEMKNGCCQTNSAIIVLAPPKEIAIVNCNTASDINKGLNINITRNTIRNNIKTQLAKLLKQFETEVNYFCALLPLIAFSVPYLNNM